MHSSAHETLSRTDHTLGHKADFSKFKKSEIKSSSAMRLEINYKEKSTAKKKKMYEHVEAKQCATKTTNGSLKKSKIK